MVSYTFVCGFNAHEMKTLQCYFQDYWSQSNKWHLSFFTKFRWFDYDKCECHKSKDSFWNDNVVHWKLIHSWISVHYFFFSLNAAGECGECITMWRIETSYLQKRKKNTQKCKQIIKMAAWNTRQGEETNGWQLKYKVHL